MSLSLGSRVRRGVAVSLFALPLLLPAGHAFAQAANASSMALPASAMGDTWKLTGGAGDNDAWMGGYESSDKATFPQGAMLIVSTKPMGGKTFADDYDTIKKSSGQDGATVTELSGVGDKALKAQINTKKESGVAYFVIVGNSATMFAVMAAPGKTSDAEPVAQKMLDAEVALMKGGSSAAPAAPPPAAPGGQAKVLSLPIGIMGDGWQLQNEKPASDGSSYTADFVPTDGSKQIVSTGVWVMASRDQADALLTQISDPLRGQGWAIVPQDDYGDRTGLKGTIGTADAAGTLYVMVVGNKVAMVLSAAQPANADDAAALAQDLVSAQEGRLY